MVDPQPGAANRLVLLRQRLQSLRLGARPGTEADRDGYAGPDGALGAERLSLLERSIWTLVWFGIMVGGLNLWGSWWSWPVIDVLAPALVAVALIGLTLCWCSNSPRGWIHQGLAMVAALATVAAPQIINIHTRIYYPTDSAALDHVAARMLAHGHNPYTGAFNSASLLLKNPMDFWTYTVSGGHVASVSYPAGSFLAYAPAFALGFHHEVVDWMDLFAWLASAILLFFIVPRYLRWLAVLVTLTGIFAGVFSGGGTDAIFIPFAMVALWRWDRYGRGRGAGLASWVGPIALGLACSIKQTPWFMVPFLAVGIYLETRRAGRPPIPVMARYLGVVAAVFLAVNLPFIIWSPRQWWHDSLLPFTSALVADGQGIVSLALHGLTGGANLVTLMVASLLALLAVLVAFGAWYHRLKRIWLLLLPVTFFFAPRSFTGYLIDLFPVALVGLLTVETVPPVTTALRWGRFKVAQLVTAGLGLATAVVTAVSLSSAPLEMTYVSSNIGPMQQHLFAVTVGVTNSTDGSVTPNFLVDLGAAHPSGFWHAADYKPVVIGPHRTVDVTLFPPPDTPAYLPPFASDYVVDAYLPNPRSLSTTNDIWHNYIPKLNQHP
jgi:uncharacterized membrane protein